MAEQTSVARLTFEEHLREAENKLLMNAGEFFRLVMASSSGDPLHVNLSEQRDWTYLLGAITEDGDRFFSRFEEYVTANHAKHFILALCGEFGDDLIIVLDGAPYFQASTVTDLAARDDLEFVTLPAYSPELNPVEECWRQLQTALSNRFFDSLDELTTAIDTALDHLSVPEVSNYF